jgi:hypothetical protein
VKAKSPIPVDPWKPHPWELADAHALRALQQGTAQPHQQQRALKWIIEAARTYDQPYRPGSDRDTAFACGMQSVGQSIVKLLNLSLDALKDPKTP